MLTIDHRQEECLSDLAFDEWQAGEVDESVSLRNQAHLEQCDRCRARQRAMQEDAEAFLARFPTLTKRPPSLVAKRAGLLRWASGGIAALAVAAGVVLFFREAPGGGTIRLKGGPQISFYVKQGERVFLGQDGERVHPGDQLRFVASTPEPRHLAILGLDTKGVVSDYFPGAGSSRKLGPVSNLALDSSVSLDDTLGDERIFALFCVDPGAVTEAREALRRDRALHERPDCDVTSFHLVKEPSR